MKLFSDLIHRNIFRDLSVSCLIYSVYLGYLSILITIIFWRNKLSVLSKRFGSNNNV